jgi:hypothetical protein
VKASVKASAKASAKKKAATISVKKARVEVMAAHPYLLLRYTIKSRKSMRLTNDSMVLSKTVLQMWMMRRALKITRNLAGVGSFCRNLSVN